ncbi:DUF4424 domain-containing protein [Methylobacterium sp. E-005]|uniref:DUF4424 domain-containing protein n=1 Tax=Methylobacterium sp. E-005 TaxID=2836549 RepID=UPI001FBBF27F|nr:DUF4424 domain-containing protein [Methylobacterium sp. E-005]MCJ2087986.1 DUF4424 domain-containing protein [Methylobacterium sp. E-005]
MVAPSRAVAALLLAAGLLSAPARANDSASELDAGGLILVPEPGIALASEDLSISLARIDVAYVFRSQVNEPRMVRIAFPLPPIDGRGLSFSALKLPQPERANFVGFTVTVDGRPIEPELEERAFVGEREVTDLLRRHGLPLNPLRFGALAAAQERIDKATWAELVKAGLFPDAEGMTEGLWRSEAKFHWLQTFPPGKEVRIAHSYAPVSGFHFLDLKEASRDSYRATYCLDDPGLATVRRLHAKVPSESGHLRAFVVPYIVTTARNWASPIGRFTLTVDKGNPEAVVSFCRTGIRKIGPTTFRWEAQDYVPDQDLRVLFVLPGPGPMGIR